MHYLIFFYFALASPHFAGAEMHSSVFSKVRYVCQGVNEGDILVLEQIRPLMNSNGIATDFFSDKVSYRIKFEFQLQEYAPFAESIKSLTYDEIKDRIVAVGSPIVGLGSRLYNRPHFEQPDGSWLDLNFDNPDEIESNSTYNFSNGRGSYGYHCNPMEIFNDPIEESLSGAEVYCIRTTGSKDCNGNVKN